MSRTFSTVLVANRGEIACRVMRSAKAEGYRTVAVYSEAEADAPHVRMADAAVCIGPPAVSESYLNAERILEAAKETGADGIHPGYGFLSENAAFAEACVAAGIVFIGPPASAIAAMGNKAEAKRLMKAAGVPCVPGYDGEDQSDHALAREAKAIGFPVLLKAAAGGGGRGMRRVDTESELASAIASARGEAEKAFGSGELIIEKLVERGRHVEIQVLADGHGACIHLGERDCSVQRRHQKVFEESPCPVMTPALRTTMGEAAVAAAQAVGYANAGTVEFLLDDDGSFYFLEMNTRLQVEHPVTELVTGLDLVALQLAVAQGATLPLAQADVTMMGHAIEARLYAEDPAKDFAPQTGTVLRWEPARGAGVRIDHGLCDGMAVTPFYDAMIAKVIAYGLTRQEALSRLDGALRDTVVLGVRTNAPLLRAIIAHEAFATGDARTDFLPGSGLLGIEAPAPSVRDLLLAAVAFIERDAQGVAPLFKGWRSTGVVGVPVKLVIGDDTVALAVEMSGAAYRLAHDEHVAELTVVDFSESLLRVAEGARRSAVRLAFDEANLFLDTGEAVWHVVDATYAPPVDASAQGDGVLKAPMVGQIGRVNVEAGVAVAKGDVLVTLEAMKMENQVVAPRDGVVESVHVAVGEQVNAGHVLVKLKAEE